jgi:hypothetical protein
MRKFLTSLNTSAVLQAILTIMVWGVICYLYATGQAVPDALLSAGSIILGYYFHTATAEALKARA